jgi:HAD superfamily hydrolase (TIGR01509 family)
MRALSSCGTSLYDLVIFDCDGVLVDSEVVTNRVFAEMLGELGVKVTLEYMFEHFMGHSMSHCLALVRNLLGRDAPADFLPEYRRRSEEVLSRELEVVPGVVEVLDALTVPWCVASNGPRDKMAVTLGKTGLLARCEAKTFTAYEVANPKPAPDLFLSAAARFGVPPPRVAVVEDSPAGVTAALAAGMSPFAYAGRTPVARLREAGGIVVFHHMRELPMLLGLGMHAT